MVLLLTVVWLPVPLLHTLWFQHFSLYLLEVTFTHAIGSFVLGCNIQCVELMVEVFHTAQL